MSALVRINNQEVAFEKKDGQIFCTSLDIARVFEKRHKHILELINEKFKNDEIKNFCEPNFRLSFKSLKIEGFRGKQRKYPYYELTKDAFSFIAMGLTGKKADKFKIAFINAFNEMEKMLREKFISPNKYLTEIMKELYPFLPQKDYKINISLSKNLNPSKTQEIYSLQYCVHNNKG